MITMIMRKLFILVLLSLFCQTTFAQPNEVKLVVTGDGETKEEATNNALRSAVEQAFGVFVSANTEILNDELVKDEIATVSSGNIKSYVENAFFERQDGIISVTLTATVSLSQLVSYTKNHGHSTEFAGSTFGANMRLYELNREATQRALINFYRELSQILPMMYDYSAYGYRVFNRLFHLIGLCKVNERPEDRGHSFGRMVIKTGVLDMVFEFSEPKENKEL